jgi:hypothetical protein
MRGLLVELHAPAKEVRGIEMTEHDGGIGDGSFLSAAAIAGRSRVRSSGLRTDPEESPGIDPRN